MLLATALTAHAEPVPSPAPAGAAVPIDRPFDFSKVALRFKQDRFAFHLRDLDSKEGSSADYWGRVLLVCVLPCPMEAPYLEELRQTQTVIDRRRADGAAMVSILVTNDRPGGAHLREAMELVKTKHLPGERFFLARRQVSDQLADGPHQYPYFLFLGRDGRLREAIHAWSKEFVGHLADTLGSLLAEGAPGGTRPKPIDLEELAPVPTPAAPPENPPSRG
ncbi:MAG: hypothetical protein HYZ53_01325 [Planctomycetes bacterium]|nr:hypothetical protein [Planctomycetota bacterium]